MVMLAGGSAVARPLTPHDVPACLQLAVSLGWPADRSKWGLLIGLGGGLCVDRHDQDGLAGTVFVNKVTESAAAIGMLLVAPAHARRGLGRFLVRTACQAAGLPTTFLYATPQGRSLYESLGFRPVDELVPYTGAYRPPRPAAPAHPARPAARGDMAAILALDTAAFGADRRPLLRRLLASADQVATADEGYGAVWTESGFRRVGPLVADSPETAKGLLDALLSGPGPAARLDLHSSPARRLAAWLAEAGLEQGSPVPLMVRGPDLPSDRHVLLSPFAQAVG